MRQTSFTRSATLAWAGDVIRGTGQIDAASGAFVASATFPRIAGEPPGTTTPEELLAASHAVCFGIALRSVLAQRGGTAARLRATATITAEKAAGRIRVVAAHLDGIVEALAGVDAAMLHAIAEEAEAACTISAILRPTVAISVSVSAATPPNAS